MIWRSPERLTPPPSCTMLVGSSPLNCSQFTRKYCIISMLVCNKTRGRGTRIMSGIHRGDPPTHLTPLSHSPHSLSQSPHSPLPLTSLPSPTHLTPLSHSPHSPPHSPLPLTALPSPLTSLPSPTHLTPLSHSPHSPLPLTSLPSLMSSFSMASTRASSSLLSGMDCTNPGQAAAAVLMASVMLLETASLPVRITYSFKLPSTFEPLLW